MKCNEVGEMMHRRLDFDLSQHEAQQVDNHMASCDACMAMNRRLVALSAQLEELPQVSPPFNIVDSIIPRLAEIDKQRDSVIKFEEAASKQPVREKKTWLYAGASGIVAAAAVFLVINFNGIEKSHNTANIASTSQSEMNSRMMSDEKGVSNNLSVEMNDSAAEAYGEADIQDGVTVFTGQVDQLMVTSKTSQELSTEQESIKTEEESSNAVESRNFESVSAIDQSGYTLTEETAIQERSQMLRIDTPIFSNPSPDSRFYLVQQEHMIMVHDFESGELLKEIEVPIKGHIYFIGWHESGVEFYIEVVDDHQQSHTITFPTGL